MADVKCEHSGANKKQKQNSGAFIKKNISLKLVNKKEESPSASPAPTDAVEPVARVPSPVAHCTQTASTNDSPIQPALLPIDGLSSSAESAHSESQKMDTGPSQTTEPPVHIPSITQDLGSVPIDIIGKAVQAPPVTICYHCDLPILIFGRMKKCKHCFCRECAKKSGGTCPRCNEGKQEFEEALPGNLFICTHGGGLYDGKGCGNSYRSKRDLDAHIQFRHIPKHPQAPLRPQAPPTSVPTSLPVPPPPFRMAHPQLPMGMSSTRMVHPPLPQQALHPPPPVQRPPILAQRLPPPIQQRVPPPPIPQQGIPPRIPQGVIRPPLTQQGLANQPLKWPNVP